MNGLQTLEPWQEYFDHPSGSLLGILSAIMSLGSLAALPAVPYTADLLGRRMGILIGCLIMILGVVLQTISANYGMFLAARFLIGFGVAIAHGASPLLITELVHTQHRAIFTTIYNSTLPCIAVQSSCGFQLTRYSYVVLGRHCRGVAHLRH